MAVTHSQHPINRLHDANNNTQAREAASLRTNRPRSQVIEGPIRPQTQHNVTIALSRNLGWTGNQVGYGKRQIIFCTMF